MAQETIDYPAMVADAKAKRAAFDVFITSLESLLALGPVGQPGTATASGFTVSSGPAVELPLGALMGKSVSNAIKLYLAACKKKQTAIEIEAALKEGGVESTSKTFNIIINNTLRLLKKAGVVLQFKDGWALAELYPEALRSRLAQQENGAKKPAKGKKHKAKRKQAKAKRHSGNTPTAESDPKVHEMPKAS